MVGLAITKDTGNTAQYTEDKREKIQALSLAKLTDTVIDDPIRFVPQKSEEKQQSSTGMMKIIKD